jgi:two-component system, cell cycle sensor histidine kinase and response regulator CckA
MALIMMSAGYWFYRHETEAIRKEKYGDLKAIADLKVDQIARWRNQRLLEARLSAAATFLQRDVTQWVKMGDRDFLKTALSSQLQMIKDLAGYQNVILADPTGRILMTLDPRLTYLEPRTKQLIAQTASAREAVIDDFFRCPDCRQVHLDAAAPILGQTRKPLAVFILRSDPERYLFPLIQSWPTPSKSAETLLIRKEGNSALFLNVLRHRTDPPLTFHVPLWRTSVAAVQAIQGKMGLFEGFDYRGVRVLSYLRPVPNSSWFMVAKVDSDEIFSEASKRAGLIGLLTLALVVLSGVITAFFYQQQKERAFQALYQAEHERAEVLEEMRVTLYSIGDGVITVGPDGRVRQMNLVAEELTGWKEAEAVSKPLSEIFHIVNEETRAEINNPIKCVMEEGLIVGLANHTLLIARDGTERPIADSCAPIRNEAGKIIGAVLVFRDQTTERKTQVLNQSRLTLWEFSGSHSLEELLRKTLDEIGALTGSPIGFYHFVEPDQKTLSLQAWSTKTLEEFCQAEGQGRHYGIDQAGVWVDCVHERRPVIHNDYKSLPHRKGMPEGHADVIRELIVPIRRSGRVVAILGVGNKPTDYTEKDIEIVSYLADVAWDITERKKLEEELSKSRDELEIRVRERTEELNVSKKQLQLMAAQLLSAQEDERKRIAHEVHDVLGSSLSAIKFKVEDTLHKNRNDQTANLTESLGAVIPLIQDTIEDARRIQTDLRPPMLDDLGIIATFSWFCRRFESIYSDINVKREITIQEEEVPEHLKVAIFRIAQEAMNNIGKYAKADLVHLRLQKTEGSIALTIQDNGQGFDQEMLTSTMEKSSSRGLGLSSMRERTDILGGQFQITSSPGEGTTIKAVWPV